MQCYITEDDHSISTAIPITPLLEKQLQAPSSLNLDPSILKWMSNSGFQAKPNTVCLVPNADGEIIHVLFGVKDTTSCYPFRSLPALLPSGIYQLDEQAFAHAHHYEQALWGFGLGSYQFNAYRSQPIYYSARLRLPQAYRSMVDHLTSINLVRDWINTPADDMHPRKLAETAASVAQAYGANIHVIEGDDLKQAGFHVLHTVGRAGRHPARLIDLQWGSDQNPRLTLIGKGVCFDSGGLDIKSAQGMLTMKKDMGGAAHALGLGRMIMQAKLPVKLRILIGALENSVGSLSYHPGDVLLTRSGHRVEVFNTDAEGRLLLCDLLTEAATEKPDILIDFATLTGAAGVALGPKLPAFFCNHDALAEAILKTTEQTGDLCWRLPLHTPYRDYLKSSIADFKNCASVPMGGAIIAALFLQYFVPNDIPWMHFDFSAWNAEEIPGQPMGAEAHILRTLFAYLTNRFNA